MNVMRRRLTSRSSSSTVDGAPKPEGERSAMSPFALAFWSAPSARAGQAARRRVAAGRS
jgi:hypothetical protein